MDRGKVALEDVCTIETLLRGGAGSWAESTDHVPFVVGKSMAVLVVLPSKAFLVISAGRDWAFLGSLRLVGKHMRFQILERSTTVRVRAASPLLAIIIETVAIGSWAVQGVPRMTRRNRESASIQALRIWLIRSGVEVGRCSAASEPGGSWAMRILARCFRRSRRRWLKRLRW